MLGSAGRASASMRGREQRLLTPGRQVPLCAAGLKAPQQARVELVEAVGT